MNTSNSSLQTEFVWPAQPGQTAGGGGDLILGGQVVGFGQYDGYWGVFRFFQNADERVDHDPIVKWSAIRGKGGAKIQAISPAVQLQFVQFPGGKDLFNPRFFQELRCPTQAVIAE